MSFASRANGHAPRGKYVHCALRPITSADATTSLLREVTGELELLNRLKQEIDRHPVEVEPERCYSSATLAKADFSAMGVKPPERFNIPDNISGIRSEERRVGEECRCR